LKNLVKRGTRYNLVSARSFDQRLITRGLARSFDQRLITRGLHSGADPLFARRQSQARTVTSLIESGQQLLREGRFEEAFERIDRAAEVSDRFQIRVAVHGQKHGPAPLEPVSHIWNDFSDSRWMERAPIAISDEYLRNILAVSDEMKRAVLETLTFPEKEISSVPVERQSQL
jgi:hypothetical protein